LSRSDHPVNAVSGQARPAEGASLVFSPLLGRRLADSDLDIVVTGAGGWIGRAVLEMVDAAFGDSLPVRVHVFGSTRRTLQLASGRRVVSHPLGDLRDLRFGPHLLVHLAFLTREHAVAQSVASYVASNEDISSVVLDHARRSPVEAVFLPSSGAVYAADGVAVADLETNPYGALKLRDESRFADVSPAADRAAIVRVFNLAGPFINKGSIYALASIISDLERGGPIQLRADHPVIRSYVHVRDLVELAFAVMLGQTPGPGVPFDTAGDREIEIGDLASLTAAMLGVPDTRIDRPEIAGDNPADRYVGDGTLLGELALGDGIELAPLEEQILDTAAFIWPTRQASPDPPGS
jgi:UDP-glucuronate decarboxylase